MRSTKILIFSKKINLFTQKIELGEKSLIILNFVLNSTLLYFLLLLITYLTISKIYFPTLIKKKHILKKFQKLKIVASSFSNFHSKFIKLISNLEYILEIFVWELKHKLISQIQDQFKPLINLLNTIDTLAKYCFSIYKQIKVTSCIKKKTKSFIII